jgi:hypothetical protein
MECALSNCTMDSTISHRVDVRDKPGFLHRLMVELAGNALISLEGDLSSFRFPEGNLVAPGTTDALKRATLVPELDFVVLRLASEFIPTIFEQVMKAGLKDKIIHVQIERDGVLELSAYDNIAPKCVVTGPGVSSSLLEDLKKRGVIRNFDVSAPGK